MSSKPTIEIDVAGETFAALAWGDPGAPTALLLHGFPDHPPSFAPVARLIAAGGFRVVAPWLRGYSPSPLKGSLTVAALANDAVHMLAAIDNGQPQFVVGHDWGAAIAYGVLAECPELSAGCAISVPPPSVLMRNALRSATQIRRSRYMLRFQPQSANDRVEESGFQSIRDLYGEWSPAFELPQELWLPLRATLEASHPRPLDYYRANARGLSELAGRGRPIKVPTTIIFGANDGCIDASMCAGAQALFTGAFAVEVIDGVGHFIHLEAPHRLADVIVRALTHMCAADFPEQPSEQPS